MQLQEQAEQQLALPEQQQVQQELHKQELSARMQPERIHVHQAVITLLATQSQELQVVLSITVVEPLIKVQQIIAVEHLEIHIPDQQITPDQQDRVAVQVQLIADLLQEVLVETVLQEAVQATAPLQEAALVVQVTAAHQGAVQVAQATAVLQEVVQVAQAIAALQGVVQAVQAIAAHPEVVQVIAEDLHPQAADQALLQVAVVQEHQDLLHPHLHVQEDNRKL